jgi:hypothetical protein
MSPSRSAALSAVFVAGLLGTGAVHADSETDRRVEAGLKIFRALMAADVNLPRKAGTDGRLLVVFHYTDDPGTARGDARSLGRLDLPTSVETTPDPTFAAYESRPPAGIFVSQPPDARSLRSIVRFGIAHHVVVYSPFEGNVESGVLGGLSIEAQVRPYINLTTLRESNIQVRDFFLKIAKVCR